MTEKKMRKWLKTFVMLLPVVMVALFGVHLHRHGLEPIEVGDEQSYQEVYYNFVPDGKDIIVEQDNSKLESFMFEYSYLLGNNSYETVVGSAGERDLVHLGTAFSVGTSYSCDIYFDLGTFTFVYKEGNTPFETRVPQFLGGGMYVDEVVSEPDYLDLAIMFDCDSSISDIEFSFANAITDYSIVKVYDDYVVYDEPLEIIAYEFNNYIDGFYSYDVFNLGVFYDWSVDVFFNGSAPLVYKPIFTLLVYEFIVELLFLMFSFITFIIRFAQKWIDGLYERKV